MNIDKSSLLEGDLPVDVVRIIVAIFVVTSGDSVRPENWIKFDGCQPCMSFSKRHHNLVRASKCRLWL